MNHRRKNLTEFNRESNGVGDIKLSALYQVFKHPTSTLHLNSGISLPIGSIDEKDGQSSRLPYPMQIGSGTYDLNLGSTYTKQWKTWSAGSQISSVIRIGKNQHDYALGNVYSGTAWVSKLITDSISTSMRIQAKVWNDISGADSDLNPMMVPTAQTNQGGNQVDLSFGLNYLIPNGYLKGHRLAVEYGLPISQSFDSIRLETDMWIAIGWQYMR